LIIIEAVVSNVPNVEQRDTVSVVPAYSKAIKQLRILRFPFPGASLSSLGAVVADLCFPKLNKLMIFNNHFIKA